MLAFLLMFLTMATLLGGGVLMHMYLYSQGVFATRQHVQRTRRPRRMVQRTFAQENVVGGDLEAALGIDVEKMADPMSRLMRRGLLFLVVVASFLVLAIILLLNIVMH